MLPPSLLNFVSGLAAGAGINLLTSISGGPPAHRPAIVADSVIWVIDAGCMALTAHLAEKADRTASLVIDGRLTEAERRSVIHDVEWGMRWQYRSALIASTVFLVLAVLLIPGLGIQ